MAVLRPEREPLKPLAENHARVKETIIFYYGHLLVGYLAAWMGRSLPLHATWLENYSSFLTFAFVLGNISILFNRLAVKSPVNETGTFKKHLASLMFGFLFTLFVGIVLGLIETIFAY